MIQTHNTSIPSIADALYALSLEGRIPDAKLLDDVARRYPEYATQLTEFVIELVLDRLHDNVMESEKANPDTDELGISPAVSRAMSRFQNRLYSVKKAGEVGTECDSLANESITAFNPFTRLNRNEFRQLVTELDANVAFVTKLRDRQIDTEKMTDGFRKEVAEKLDVTKDVLVAHFNAPQNRVSAGRQFFKAVEKPSTEKRQSFKEAVRSSGLSERQQQRLMSL